MSNIPIKPLSPKDFYILYLLNKISKNTVIKEIIVRIASLIESKDTENPRLNDKEKKLIFNLKHYLSKSNKEIIKEYYNNNSSDNKLFGITQEDLLLVFNATISLIRELRVNILMILGKIIYNNLRLTSNTINNTDSNADASNTELPKLSSSDNYLLEEDLNFSIHSLPDLIKYFSNNSFWVKTKTDIEDDVSTETSIYNSSYNYFFNLFTTTFKSFIGEYLMELIDNAPINLSTISQSFQESKKIVCISQISTSNKEFDVSFIFTDKNQINMKLNSTNKKDKEREEYKNNLIIDYKQIINNSDKDKSNNELNNEQDQDNINNPNNTKTNCNIKIILIEKLFKLTTENYTYERLLASSFFEKYIRLMRKVFYNLKLNDLKKLLTEIQEYKKNKYNYSLHNTNYYDKDNYNFRYTRFYNDYKLQLKHLSQHSATFFKESEEIDDSLNSLIELNHSFVNFINFKLNTQKYFNSLFIGSNSYLDGYDSNVGGNSGFGISGVCSLGVIEYKNLVFMQLIKSFKYYSNKEFFLAKESFISCLHNCKQCGDIESMIVIENFLSKIAIREGEFIVAIEYICLAIKRCSESFHNELKPCLFQDLYRILHQLGLNNKLINKNIKEITPYRILTLLPKSIQKQLLSNSNNRNHNNDNSQILNSLISSKNNLLKNQYHIVLFKSNNHVKTKSKSNSNNEYTNTNSLIEFSKIIVKYYSIINNTFQMLSTLSNNSNDACNNIIAEENHLNYNSNNQDLSYYIKSCFKFQTGGYIPSFPSDKILEEYEGDEYNKIREKRNDLEKEIKLYCSTIDSNYSFIKKEIENKSLLNCYLIGKVFKNVVYDLHYSNDTSDGDNRNNSNCIVGNGNDDDCNCFGYSINWKSSIDYFRLLLDKFFKLIRETEDLNNYYYKKYKESSNNKDNKENINKSNESNKLNNNLIEIIQLKKYSISELLETILFYLIELFDFNRSYSERVFLELYFNNYLHNSFFTASIETKTLRDYNNNNNVEYDNKTIISINKTNIKLYVEIIKLKILSTMSVSYKANKTNSNHSNINTINNEDSNLMSSLLSEYFNLYYHTSCLFSKTINALTFFYDYYYMVKLKLEQIEYSVEFLNKTIISDFIISDINRNKKSLKYDQNYNKELYSHLKTIKDNTINDLFELKKILKQDCFILYIRLLSITNKAYLFNHVVDEFLKDRNNDNCSSNDSKDDYINNEMKLLIDLHNNLSNNVPNNSNTNNTSRISILRLTNYYSLINLRIINKTSNEDNNKNSINLIINQRIQILFSTIHNNSLESEELEFDIDIDQPSNNKNENYDYSVKTNSPLLFLLDSISNNNSNNANSAIAFNKIDLDYLISLVQYKIILVEKKISEINLINNPNNNDCSNISQYDYFLITSPLYFLLSHLINTYNCNNSFNIGDSYSLSSLSQKSFIAYSNLLIKDYLNKLNKYRKEISNNINNRQINRASIDDNSIDTQEISYVSDFYISQLINGVFRNDNSDTNIIRNSILVNFGKVMLDMNFLSIINKTYHSEMNYSTNNTNNTNKSNNEDSCNTNEEVDISNSETLIKFLSNNIINIGDDCNFTEKNLFELIEMTRKII